jgi:hypothetical protein
MASVIWGWVFYSILNLRLIWSLLLFMWVDIMLKSVPYCLRSANKVLISLLVQIADLLRLELSFAIFLSLGRGMCLRVMELTKVEMVEGDETMVI